MVAERGHDGTSGAGGQESAPAPDTRFHHHEWSLCPASDFKIIRDLKQSLSWGLPTILYYGSQHASPRHTQKWANTAFLYSLGITRPFFSWGSKFTSLFCFSADGSTDSEMGFMGTEAEAV